MRVPPPCPPPRSVLQSLYAAVVNLYGLDPNKLGDFGFTPHKKLGVESAATRAQSVVKAEATRARKKAALAAATASPGTPASPAVVNGTTNGASTTK